MPRIRGSSSMTSTRCWTIGASISGGRANSRKNKPADEGGDREAGRVRKKECKKGRRGGLPEKWGGSLTGANKPDGDRVMRGDQEIRGLYLRRTSQLSAPSSEDETLTSEHTKGLPVSGLRGPDGR